MPPSPGRPLARTLTHRCTHCPCRLQLASELPVFSPHVGRSSSSKLSGLRKGSLLVGVEDEARVTHDSHGRPGGQSQETGLLTSQPALPPPPCLLPALCQPHSAPTKPQALLHGGNRKGGLGWGVHLLPMTLSRLCPLLSREQDTT